MEFPWTRQCIKLFINFVLSQQHISSIYSQKKRADEAKPSEEKIKNLKKRNAELAAIARKLEEKAKQLQQENQKVNRPHHRTILLFGARQPIRSKPRANLKL